MIFFKILINRYLHLFVAVVARHLVARGIGRDRTRATPATDRIHPKEADPDRATRDQGREHAPDRHHIQMSTLMIIQMIDDHTDQEHDQKDHTDRIDREEHQLTRENQDTQDHDMI